MPITASLALTMPELILSIGAMFLLMVAAFGGDGLARAIGWGAVALFAAAGFALTGPAGNGGPGFDGLYIADNFAAFAKLLIYIAAAVSVMVAPGFFGRAGGYRAEYPILILFSAVGMGMMVSAGDLLTLYVGLELQSLSAYVLASFQRRDARSAEAGLPATSTRTAGTGGSMTPSAARAPRTVIARTARLASHTRRARSPHASMLAAERSSVRVTAGSGVSLNVASTTTPSAPSAPVCIRCISNPVTFFTTRPPARVDTPVAVTATMPMTKSLASMVALP